MCRAGRVERAGEQVGGLLAVERCECDRGRLQELDCFVSAAGEGGLGQFGATIARAQDEHDRGGGAAWCSSLQSRR